MHPHAWLFFKRSFNGAAIVYYSYIGYDSVSTMAEEVHKPAKTMPIGISGSVLVVTVLYCLMAASLVVLVPYDQVSMPYLSPAIMYNYRLIDPFTRPVLNLHQSRRRCRMSDEFLRNCLAS